MLAEGRRFSELAEARPVVCGRAARGGVRWKSQHRKKLCFSLLMSKNLKLKKVNKSFVPEPISCFSDSLCLFHLFISWSYIFGCGPGYVTSYPEHPYSAKEQLSWVDEKHFLHSLSLGTGGNVKSEIPNEPNIFCYDSCVAHHYKNESMSNLTWWEVGLIKLFLERILFSCRRFSQHILSSTDRAIFWRHTGF